MQLEVMLYLGRSRGLYLRRTFAYYVKPTPMHSWKVRWTSGIDVQSDVIIAPATLAVD